ncbi:MAG: choice-of-anchor L domain-containing protein [Proteobacteria bacterium]|nr:choice-of-anchor L domain-containing protein [Pseudomonadota bacterium]
MRRWIMILAILALGGAGSACDGDDPKPIKPDDGNDPKPDQIIVTKPSETCDRHEQLCEGVCIDVTRSRQHCGGCSTVCGAGEGCNEGVCRQCTGSQTLCGEMCVNTMTSADHCGGCGLFCPPNMQCRDGGCVCSPGYVDCDGDLSNGCEVRGSCDCRPGDVMPCYDGPVGTADVGECRSGTMTCLHDVSGDVYWGLCEGAVYPVFVNICTELDYNCNGLPDGHEDWDGDGYSICDGDCCDNPSCGLSNPEIVNPGMLPVPGSDIDYNCSGTPGSSLPAWQDFPILPYTYNVSDLNATARAMAQAMGIIWQCESGADCHYGLLEARLTRSNSSALPDKRQVNVLSDFANAEGVKKILPREGNTFAVISSGEALDVFRGVSSADLEIETIVSETVNPDGSVTRVSADSRIPDRYAAVHGGKLASHELCQAETFPPIFDSVQLHLKIRAPRNAKGFQFDFRFFSREYPEFICSKFNDFFLVLLKSTHEEMKAYPDGNIAFDIKGNPVSVNNGFFTTCRRIPCQTQSDCPAFMTCESNLCSAGADTCRDGDGAIEAYYPQPYGYGYGRGGGTAWLTTTAPVVGGEDFELDFYLWDTGDRKYDSSVILDNFKWLLDETKVGTAPSTGVN